MYIKPTAGQRKWAIRLGDWTFEQAERGYDIFEFGNTGMFEICRIDEAYTNRQREKCSDEDCVEEAIRSGFCKVIPVEELPENFERRYLGWIDTPENRDAIRKFCEA